MTDREELRPLETRSPSRFSVIALGVLASLIATILYSIFYSPIMSAMSYIGDTIISPFYAGYVDAPYGQAALGYINAYFYLISTIISYIVFGSSGGIVGSTLAVMLITRARPLTASGRAFNRLVRKNIIPVVVIIFVILMLFWISYMQNFTYNSMQASITLDNRIRILSPYLTDMDQKMLISEWAQMQTRHDYEQLISKLDHIAKDHAVALPKPLI